jgi:hypothetical protein
MAALHALTLLPPLVQRRTATTPISSTCLLTGLAGLLTVLFSTVIPVSPPTCVVYQLAHFYCTPSATYYSIFFPNTPDFLLGALDPVNSGSNQC